MSKEQDKTTNENLCHSVPTGNTEGVGPEYTRGAYKQQGVLPSNAVFRYFFTLSCEEIALCQVCQLWGVLKEISKEFYFQGEQGKGGYKHWQGCFSLKEKLRWNQVKNLISQKIHLENPNNWFKCKTYCQKIETRILGPFSHLKKPLKTITDLRTWQSELYEILQTEPNDREIIWIADIEGNNGKTQFLKYCYVNFDSIALLQSSKNDNLAYAVKDKDPEIVMFNISRSKEHAFNYDGLESLKDGFIFSGKYESGAQVFNSPHVVVLCNFLPEIHKMTHDRWRIYDIVENKLRDITEKTINTEFDDNSMIFDGL